MSVFWWLGSVRGRGAVSYTHLDVYKRQELDRALTAVDGRAAGTCELSPCETLEETLALARSKGALHVLVLDADGERMVEV